MDTALGSQCMCGHTLVAHWRSASPSTFSPVLGGCCSCQCPFFSRPATQMELGGVAVVVLALDSLFAAVIWRLVRVLG